MEVFFQIDVPSLKAANRNTSKNKTEKREYLKGVHFNHTKRCYEASDGQIAIKATLDNAINVKDMPNFLLDNKSVGRILKLFGDQKVLPATYKYDNGDETIKVFGYELACQDASKFPVIESVIPTNILAADKIPVALDTHLDSKCIKQAIDSFVEVSKPKNKLIPLNFFQLKKGKGERQSVYLQYENLTITIMPLLLLSTKSK